MTDTALLIKDVDKFYGPVDFGVHAVKKLNMDVRKGEIIALLGSSGCGKTSTLRMIAGFEAVSRGTISLAGKEVQTLPPVRRNVAMAFEGYSLYPPLTVRENIAFALKASKLSQGVVDEKVASIAKLLEIEDILGRYPSSISGGQQQRASLGRALIRDANLHLLDEPMGQLEPQLRALLRGRIKHFIKERGLTAILVTHDQTEANALADRIAVMEGGVLQQFDTPQKIKERPANLFTGTFVGEPPMNVFEASVTGSDSKMAFGLKDGVRLEYAASDFSHAVRDELIKRQKVVLGIRPYSVRRSADGVTGRVAVNQWLGDQTHIAADFAGGTMVLVEHDRTELDVGQPIGIHLDPSSLHVFDGESGRAISHGQELA
ncbi:MULTISPECIES: ABC transporter ATP-binding protein [Ensifer]|uniref:ABC transporter ATP-binding protein n=1 Tax=Ensifer adhaerens TaxID=106592 RepID=A0ABY8HCE5_ENSAD|nr:MULTISPECIES: ABC transporter ATP-binding protein [Ensifer]ANK73150.1 ABC transporter ATP-binding protein [Ensifer adhaerens]KDP74985.1 ABC transporter ATP-binding protein [Ensifer adhaerens]KQX32480.1 ABC transporter ATP-binding protein [Ensifer sp. Root423]KQZ58045.1 ABC transporter ATP-binding protein [Ensifer sp. Root558]MCY1743695.1 ABC transporter ATP-binding protein [Ensifer sp. SL37]